MRATIDFDDVRNAMLTRAVERPNRSTAGTLSGHAAGEPFEKSVYNYLKSLYPDKIFKQYEYLNDLYMKSPQVMSLEGRKALFDSPTVLFLLSRGDKATKEWSPEHVFEERQNDTADILYYYNEYYDLIDVKTRNIEKAAQPPNIISAYKLARACSYMIDNAEYDKFRIDYIEIDWTDEGDFLRCCDAHYASLFKANPDTLYINWAAGMQIQFHVCDLDQSWSGTMDAWARHYIAVFVQSAKARCEKMIDDYVKPFEKYLNYGKE